jgi:hypothetical protein
MTAAALANMANRKLDSANELKPRMIAMYNKALCVNNKQLACERAYLDEALITIHLMALYELLMPDFSFKSWKAHVQGTLHLLSVLGTKQLDINLGRQLSSLVLTPVILKIIATGLLPPPESVDMIR